MYVTEASSVVSAVSMIFNPDEVMGCYSAIVTCEINPTSTAEFCQVIARNDSAGLLVTRSSEWYITMYIYSYVCT